MPADPDNIYLTTGASDGISVCAKMVHSYPRVHSCEEQPCKLGLFELAGQEKDWVGRVGHPLVPLSQ